MDTRIDAAVILIVDDMPDNLKVMGSFLRDNGYSVLLASNGPEALALAEAKQPHMILLDVQMPEMDGYQVCSLLKGRDATAHIPVLFFTAHSLADDIVRGFDAGAVDYVSKPFNGRELLSRMHTHLLLASSLKRNAEMNRELEALNAMKDTFFSIIAHDLRGPIGTFVRLAELLSDESKVLSLPRDEILRELTKTALRTQGLLENLLTWARSQKGELVARPSHVNISKLMKNASESAEVSAREKGILITADAEEGVIAVADESMLNVIAGNLLSNAVKFTGDNGAIKVSVRKNGNAAVVTVSDNGLGIRSENMEKLFSLSGKISTSGTRGEKGSGLGLILCRDFAEKNGGSLSAQSRPGEGSTFTLTLPSAEEAFVEKAAGD